MRVLVLFALMVLVAGQRRRGAANPDNQEGPARRPRSSARSSPRIRRSDAGSVAPRGPRSARRAGAPFFPRTDAARRAARLTRVGTVESLMSSSAETSGYCQGHPVFVPTTGGPITHVAVVARHGDRVPQNALPPLENAVWQCPRALVPAALQSQFSGLFANSSSPGVVGSCINGQLTQQGVDQQRALGRAFRSLFVEGANAFLPARFEASKVGVRSTAVGRTVLSAYYYFQGLYPGSSPAIRTFPDAEDNAYPNANLCPELRGVWNTVIASPSYKAFYARSMQPLIAKYGPIWQMNVTDSTMKHVNDMIRSRFCHKLPLPPGLTTTDAAKILVASRRTKNLQAEPLRAIQLSAGAFLSDILADSKRNLYQHYSAHDDTLRSLLLALHAFDGRWPPYASHAALVFRADSVSLQFDGALRQMAPPCRGLYCATKDFEALVAKYRTTCK